MGVLNATPDSFYVRSRQSDPAAAVRCGAEMIAQGADILDLGGESSRPGAEPISPSEELRRILPALGALRARFPKIPISIDTRHSIVARQALREGASMINDISALRHDPEMAEVIAAAGCPVVVMHMQGNPATMQRAPIYGDIVEELNDFFEERITALTQAGIPKENVILDPGMGFGKTAEHNMILLRNLARFKKFQLPLLVGVSRKSLTGLLSADRPGEVLPPEERLEGTLAVQLWAFHQGADGLRVHDVRAAKRSLQTWAALARIAS